ncbi:iron-sulfur cluster assembly protein SufD [Geomicrobium sp. JCM 19037]|uniref:Fe-S cluster assembly protein SufD n=1 Tax=unclassified Geomicrobium TaxID=2628951 RepID=UPI00045F2738|nr:Fe-S cluster assembly protein SufD [Geomicrobium sp. JCM 19037]GAK04248.1 iron-sulfur cluster assembly protein SufD [Geomicrobium sp. JCM 19037]
MAVETKWAFDRETVKAFSEKRNEPAWLAEKRLEALTQAASLPMPNPDKTKLTRWNFSTFETIEASGRAIAEYSDLPSDITRLAGEESSVTSALIQRDGETVYHQAAKELADQGVIFTDLKTAAVEHSDLLEKYFMGEAVPTEESQLTALHTALVNGGVFIYVPKNVEVEVPLQSIFWQEDTKTGLFNHVIIVAEDQSRVTYVENYVSFSKEEAAANIIAEVYVGQGAEVKFGAVDNLESGVTSYITRRAHVQKDGRIEWALGQMNEGNTISDNTTHLLGDGSYGDTKTVVVGRGEQLQNFTSNMIGHGKHSEGYILTHGVMKDSSSAIFNGINKIEKGGTKAHSEQTGRVLMLSSKARGDANPILLIDEDDVTAGHAASVGKIDPMQMFYMQSRGLSKVEAERLIIHGFLEPVVGELPIESVKSRLTEVIEGKVY